MKGCKSTFLKRMTVHLRLATFRRISQNVDSLDDGKAAVSRARSRSEY
jgi:hypothetical protein